MTLDVRILPGRVFGGGIGKHADRLRARLCEGLRHFGIEIGFERNRAANGRKFRFSSDTSPVKLYVIALDEEL